MASINRKYKDQLFRVIFSKKKDLLSLYNALADKDYTDENALEVNTLEDVICIGMKNDVSFIIDNYQCLYEHQSTVNPNMPLRGLFYFADLYKERYSGSHLYREKRIPILTPRYIVLYNGSKRMGDRLELRLSDSFINQDGSADVEVVAHLININAGHNENLYKKCHLLHEYVEFTTRMRDALMHCKPSKRRNAAQKVIDECIQDGILVDILRAERTKLMASILSEFNMKAWKKVMREEGYDEGRISIVSRMISQNCTDSEIIRLTGCTQEMVDAVRQKAQQ